MRVLALALLLSAGPLANGSDLPQAAHTAWRLGDRVLRAYPRSLAQTTDGYLWLGSEEGLVRFDGQRFTSWQLPDGRQLPSTSVIRVLGGRDGSLWIATSSGLARLANSQLTEYSELRRTFVSSLIERHDGTVWAGTNAGLNGAALVCAIRHPEVDCRGADGMFGRFISALYEDRHGALWVGAATGLWRWQGERPERFSAPYAFPEIHAIVEDAAGQLLIAINHEIRRFVGGRWEPYTIPGLPAVIRPTALLRDRRGWLWIGRQDGGVVRVVDGRSEPFTRQDGLSGEFVSSLFEDRQGNVWIGTINGLDRFRQLTVATFSAKHGLISERMTSVVASKDGTVWFGSIAGLNRWEQGQITLPQIAGRTSSYVASLYEDRAGRLWVSSPEGLAYIRAGILTAVAEVSAGYIHAIAEDGAGDIWVAHQGRGLLRIRDGSVVERTPWSAFGGRIARALAGDARGGAWIGFFQGGVSYFAGGTVRASYTAAEGLGRGVVSHVRVDADGVVWAATETGLSRMAGARARTMSSRHGLPCDRVLWSIEDHNRDLWLYTHCGVARVGRDALQAWSASADADHAVDLTLFGDSDGVSSHVEAGSYSPKVTISSDGRLWFTTNLGVSVIDPAQVPFDHEPPPVHMEQATADDAMYDVSRDGELPAGTRDLRIEYTAISLGVPEKVRFRYMLEGRDREWVDAGNRRQAFYTDLPPNDYRFRVVAANGDGVWNEEGAAWVFSVAPAFYETWAFRGACGVMIGAAVWGLYRRRIRQVRQAEDLRFQERLAERTRIAQALHDTLLQGFISASMHLHVVAEEVSDHPIRSKLDAVLQRIARSVDEGRQSVSGLRSSLAAEHLEQTLARDADFLRGEQPVQVRIVVEGPREPIQPLIRDEMYRVAREALANALRHAKAAHVNVELEYASDGIRVRISDDGCGMEPEIVNEGRGGHWGMQDMRQRAKSIGATLKVWSRANVGTEVELCVPARATFTRLSHRRQRRFRWGKSA